MVGSYITTPRITDELAESMKPRSLIGELAGSFVNPVLADEGFHRRRLRWKRERNALIDITSFSQVDETINRARALR